VHSHCTTRAKFVPVILEVTKWYKTHPNAGFGSNMVHWMRSLRNIF